MAGLSAISGEQQLLGVLTHVLHSGTRTGSRGWLALDRPPEGEGVTHPRLRYVVHGEVPLQSYVRLQSPRQFSEELLEKILRGGSAQDDTETVIDSAQARPGCATRHCCRSPRSRVCSRWSGIASGLAQAQEGTRCSSGGWGLCCCAASSRASAWKALHEIAQVLATIEAEYAEHSPLRRRRRCETTMGGAQNSSTDLLTTSS
jgi:hypothetical protein